MVVWSELGGITNSGVYAGHLLGNPQIWLFRAFLLSQLDHSEKIPPNFCLEGGFSVLGVEMVKMDRLNIH